MTIYVALDSIDGQTLPTGRIVGINRTVAGLTAAGFAAPTYTTGNNRVVAIDETDDAVWDNDCVPGWFLVGGVVQFTTPVTDLEGLREDIRAAQAQIKAWAVGLDAPAVGQPLAKVQQGHARLYSGLGALYIVCTDATRTIPYRKAYAGLLRQGAADVIKPEQFYSLDTGSFDEPERGDSAIDWWSWVSAPDAPGVPARENIGSNTVIRGNVPAAVQLIGDDWVTGLTG